MLLLYGNRVFASISTEPPVINSISVAGTNLDFVATFPPDMANGFLEMRPTLTDEWQSVAALNVPADGGIVEFVIPMPTLSSAFFRLNVSMQTATNASAGNRISEELQFVAVPPLGPDSTNTDEAVFHFTGLIDGSDHIVIRRQGALWEHMNWAWPRGAVTVNGTASTFSTRLVAVTMISLTAVLVAPSEVDASAAVAAAATPAPASIIPCASSSVLRPRPRPNLAMTSSPPRRRGASSPVLEPATIVGSVWRFCQILTLVLSATSDIGFPGVLEWARSDRSESPQPIRR